MAKHKRRNNNLNPGYWNARYMVNHTADKVGDWFENNAGMIYKVKSYRYSNKGFRLMKLGYLGTDKKDFEISEFDLKNWVELKLLKRFNKWSYV